MLFSGTGCQIAGLLRYLNRPSPNLYTADIICHGVPSPLFLEKHLAAISPEGYANFFFRRKGWSEVSEYCCGVTDRYGKTKVTSGADDLYMNLFINGYSQRECCYGCPYASQKRTGDITLGDIHPACIKGSDVSVMTCFTAVLATSEKGKELIGLIGAEAERHPIDLEAYLRTNAQLHSPCKRPEERDQIYVHLMHQPYREADIARYKVRLPLRRRAKNLIRGCVPVSIKKWVRTAKRKASHVT